MLDRLFSTTGRMFWSRFLGLVLLTYVLVTEPPELLDTLLLDACELIGFAMLTLAALGRMWSLVFLAGKKDDVLVTDGPYSAMRNPLYTFSFIGSVGFGLAVENPILALILGLVFVAYYSFVIRREERLLLGVFGQPYADYCASTPRWIPNPRLYREPSTVKITTCKLRHGMVDAMWFIWAYFLWQTLETLREAGYLQPLF